MGVYHPATIVRDAQRHGQVIRPADVSFSDWLCVIEGTGLSLGPHPMEFHRRRLSAMGAVRSADLAGLRHGARVRVAGAVVVRQRPGTAKGFVFLNLEDETGLCNVIVAPPLFRRSRLALVEEPFLLVEGELQHQEGVISVRAERLAPLGSHLAAVPSHDFH